VEDLIFEIEVSHFELKVEFISIIVMLKMSIPKLMFRNFFSVFHSDW